MNNKLLFKPNEEMRLKDNLISKILLDLSKLDLTGELILKGGTSLTKGYKFGSRLSEDMDLVLTWKGEGTNKKDIKKIEEAISNNYLISNRKPESGSPRAHLSFNIEWKGVSIKFDLKNTKLVQEYKLMEIFEFDQEFKLIKVQGLKFNIGNLHNTFFEKVFAFQNKTYKTLHKNARGKQLIYSKVPMVSKEERMDSDLTKGELIRLARHVFDITKIWDEISFPDFSLLPSLQGNELKNPKIIKSEYLSYIYQNEKISNFIIFKNLEEIETYLEKIKDNFITQINPSEIIKKIALIRKELKKKGF